MTVGEMLEARGRKKGLEEGRKQVLQNFLPKLLRSRFGAVPKAALARIRAASLDELERWFDQALTAKTLAEALADR